MEPIRLGGCSSRVSRVLALLAGLAAALVLAAPAAAAAPNYILVSGPGLRHPVLLANWNENLRLLLAVANSRPAGSALAKTLHGRRKLDLAEFWAWSGKPRPTKASDANQHGSFYPAHGSLPAVIDITVQGVAAPHRVSATVLKILRRHGVPTRY
jgi:hypothetical protein